MTPTLVGDGDEAGGCVGWGWGVNGKSIPSSQFGCELKTILKIRKSRKEGREGEREEKGREGKGKNIQGRGENAERL